jgi:hypothetical protein
VWHGERAPQYLVDVMQDCVRRGDMSQGTDAERALRLLDREPASRRLGRY